MTLTFGQRAVHVSWFRPNVFNSRPLNPEEWVLDAWSWDLPLFTTIGVTLFGFVFEVVSWK